MKFTFAVMTLAVFIFCSPLFGHGPDQVKPDQSVRVTGGYSIYLYTPPPVQYIVIPQPTISVIYPSYLAPRPFQPFRNMTKYQIRKDLHRQVLTDYYLRMHYGR